MFQYLKQWLHESVIPQFVGRNIESIANRNREISNDENSRMDDPSSSLDASPRESSRDISTQVDPRELPRPARNNEESFIRTNCSKNCESGNKKNVCSRIPGCWLRRAGRDEEMKNRRELSLEEERKKKHEKKCPEKDICRCENCSVVATIGECGICLEPLQNRGVKSCPICDNLVCSSCSEKLKNCPFCRNSMAMQKNRAIERLLDGLFLPCRNARNGCRKMLNSETRSRHEACCDRSSTGCPAFKNCLWNGSPASILKHLKKAHNLGPLEDNGVAVEISSFRKKIASKQKEYTIYLTCYGQLFAITVIPRRKKLTLSFSQLGYVTRITEKIANKKYGVFMKIDGAGKRIRGFLPFGKLDRETRDLSINCEQLFLKQDNISYDVDNVQIEIFIKEINSTSDK